MADIDDRADRAPDAGVAAGTSGRDGLGTPPAAAAEHGPRDLVGPRRARSPSPLAARFGWSNVLDRGRRTAWSRNRRLSSPFFVLGASSWLLKEAIPVYDRLIVHAAPRRGARPAPTRGGSSVRVRRRLIPSSAQRRHPPVGVGLRLASSTQRAPLRAIVRATPRDGHGLAEVRSCSPARSLADETRCLHPTAGGGTRHGRRETARELTPWESGRTRRRASSLRELQTTREAASPAP